MGTSAHVVPMPLVASRPPLSDAAVDALGTLLALAWRISCRAIGGIAHLLAAAAMVILGLILARI